MGAKNEIAGGAAGARRDLQQRLAMTGSPGRCGAERGVRTAGWEWLHVGPDVHSLLVISTSRLD